MGNPIYDFCKSFLDNDEEESVQHLLCDCSLLLGRKLHLIAMYHFRDLECLPLINLMRFVRVTAFKLSNLCIFQLWLQTENIFFPVICEITTICKKVNIEFIFREKIYIKSVWFKIKILTLEFKF